MGNEAKTGIEKKIDSVIIQLALTGKSGFFNYRMKVKCF